jgi:FHA domain-containing protein
MIRIKALAHNGQPLPQPISAEFDETGGSIGRAERNTLILPDARRYISRTHASVIFRGGSYLIRNLSSSTSIYINNQPLGNDRESPIAEGDQILIGGYALQVSGSKLDVHAASQVRAEQPQSGAAASGTSKDDPLAIFAEDNRTDPFGDLFSAPSAAAHATHVSAEANHPDHLIHAPQVRKEPSLEAGVIRADIDPFAGPISAAKEPTPARLPDDFDLGLSSSSSSNIDELFNLDCGAGSSKPGSSSTPFIGDAAGLTDPLLALDRACDKQPEFGPVQRDDALELYSAFRLPQARPDPASTIPDSDLQTPQSPAPATAPPETGSQSMFLNWEASALSGGEIKTMIFPSQKREPKDAAPRATSVSPVETEASPAYGPTSSPALAGSYEELLGALLKGAGVPNLNMPVQLTPELMNTIGQLLREATRGTLDLLLARTLTKREVRAEITMIMARENNPLKFSPNVEVALAHLLAPQGQGFMSPVRSMQNAYDDLRAHQLAFMAGMRAALAGVLTRFDPKRLEKRLIDKTVLDSLLPMNRRAKLWDLFEELFSEISREAEDDFHTLFGKAFLHAYEEQLARLEKDTKR